MKLFWKPEIKIKSYLWKFSINIFDYHIVVKLHTSALTESNNYRARKLFHGDLENKIYFFPKKSDFLENFEKKTFATVKGKNEQQWYP